MDWLTRLFAFLAGLGSGGALAGPLAGVVLKPFDDDKSEPYWTLSRAVMKHLQKEGVRFETSGEHQCELDWEFLGGSKLRLRVAMKIGEILITENVREGIPMREQVDFDIDRMMRHDEDTKKELFLLRGAEKLVEQYALRHHRDLGRQTAH